MFQNAHNTIITGGEFTTIENHAHDAVSTTLWQRVAAGAIFDSAERHPPARCYPGTRERIINQIKSWIYDRSGADSEEHILWLSGPAGGGKSAIMQSICELLRDSDPGRYAGSFFFSRGHEDRGKSIKLFSTLSYQLAVQFPSIRTEINNILSRDPSLPTKSIDIQLRSLIIDPLLRCKDFPSVRPILIIDGLDECDDDDGGIDAQRNIITLISTSITEHHVPVRFLIASRPEYWIRDTFKTSLLPDITLSVSLRSDIDVDKNIRKYLEEGFERIRLENLRIMQSVQPPWPPYDIIRCFVEKASGQYIYASTVLKFVGKYSRFSNPQKQLHIISTTGPRQASAFCELDQLYTTILSEYPDWETMKRVLGALLLYDNLTVIEVVLGVDPADITLVLDALRSLIDVLPRRQLSQYEDLLTPIFGPLENGCNGRISFSHLSFREFLRDEIRSGPHYVDVVPIITEITHAFFGIISRNLDQNYEIETHSFLNLSLEQYRKMMTSALVIAANCRINNNISVLFQWLNVMAKRLATIHSHHQMTFPACFVQDTEWIMRLLCKIRWKSKKAPHLQSPLHRRKPPAHHDELIEMVSPDDYTSFYRATERLEGIVYDAREIGKCCAFALSPQGNGCNIPHTLLSILIFSRNHVDGLFAMPGNSVSDTLLTLQKYRLHVGFYRVPKEDKWSVYLVGFSEFYNDCWKQKEWWRSCSAMPEYKLYKDQHIRLVYECMKSVLNNLDNVWEHSMM